jgi:hypothetical protein
LLGAAIILLAACSSATDATPVADASLDFESARIRWAASHPSSYGFDFIAYTAMLPSADFHHVEVAGGRVTTVRSQSTGVLVGNSVGFTIDDLWARLITAKSQGESLSHLYFNSAGVPIEVMIGSFANDGGVHYEVRNFVPHP